MDLNTTLKRLRCAFFMFAALLATLALMSWQRGGTTIVTQGRAFWLQSLLVAINVAALPLAWKMMTLRRIHDIVSKRSAEGLRSYYRFSVIRLCLIAAPATIDFLAAGLQIDDTYAVLAIMLSVAMLMFYPTQLLYNNDVRERR